MKPIVSCFATILAVTLLAGCKADVSGLDTLTVAEAAALFESNAPVSFCDANNDDTRSELGVVSGAILLSSFNEYDAASELPSDGAQRLVFYCHSEMCGAAATAARKAIAAGRTQVAVMPEGIKGWIKAGRPVTMPSAS